MPYGVKPIIKYIPKDAVVWCPFDYRMRFLNNGVIDNKINFKSVYLCCDFLPRQIILEHLDVPKTQTKVA